MCSALGGLHREIAAFGANAIAVTIARETSKPLLDALSGDVLVTLEHLRYYEAHAARVLRLRRIGKPSFFFRGARFETHFEPHGVALIFGPSNYPFQLSVIPLVPHSLPAMRLCLSVRSVRRPRPLSSRSFVTASVCRPVWFRFCALGLQNLQL